MHVFVCPDCRCVHAEPAEALYLLAVRCSDCDLMLRFHEGFDVVAAVVPEAA